MPDAAPSGRSFGACVRRGERVVGTFVKLPALESVDLAARCGFDFLVVDAEHSQLADADVARLVRHATALGLPAVVRVPSGDAGQVNRLLEAGAVGIQLSTVRRVAQAVALRSATRYPPEGSRSVSAAQPAAGYGRRPLAEYLAAMADEPPLVIGQVETATTDDPLEQLAGPLDAVFLGTTDLAADLGVPGEGAHPAVVARIEEIAAAARATGTVLGGWAPG
ncbi:MAG: HpcH/HpaI aldolase family protein, partial [Acidimicrobiales bacterium]